MNGDFTLIQMQKISARFLRRLIKRVLPTISSSYVSICERYCMVARSDPLKRIFDNYKFWTTQSSIFLWPANFIEREGQHCTIPKVINHICSILQIISFRTICRYDSLGGGSLLAQHVVIIIFTAISNSKLLTIGGSTVIWATGRFRKKIAFSTWLVYQIS